MLYIIYIPLMSYTVYTATNYPHMVFMKGILKVLKMEACILVESSNLADR